MTLHFAEGPEDVPGLLPCSRQSNVGSNASPLSPRTVRRCYFTLQQLTHKDAHLILEILQDPPLLLDYPLQLCYPSFGRGQLLCQLRNGALSLGNLVHQVIHVGLYSVPL